MTVALAIPTYNFAKYLPELFDSLLNQSYKDFSIFLADDASVDKSKEIINSYEERFRAAGIPFKAYYQLYNIGPRWNTEYIFNKAVESGAKYVGILEADDMLACPDSLSKRVEFLDNNPDFVAVHSDVEYREPSGSGIARFWKEVSPYPVEHPTSFQHLIRDNRIFTCTFLCKTDIYKWAANYNLLQDLEVFLGDYMISLRIAKYHKIGYIDEPLSVYRHRADSESHKDRALVIEDTSRVKMLAAAGIGLA